MLAGPRAAGKESGFLHENGQLEKGVMPPVYLVMKGNKSRKHTSGVCVHVRA